MPTLKIIFALCLICFVSPGSRAQQAVPPPPKPADDGPNLEVTMKFIQDKLNDIRTLRYSVHVEFRNDSLPNYLVELTSIVADPQHCTISYHQRLSTGDKDPRPTNLDVLLNLKEVKTITVQSYEELHNDSVGEARSLAEAASSDPSQGNAPAGPKVIKDQAEYNAYMTALNTTDPAARAAAMEGFIAQYPNSSLKVDALQQAAAKWTVRPPIFLVRVKQSQTRVDGLYVDDEELANRLARAITHAVELCTPDKKPEPF